MKTYPNLGANSSQRAENLHRYVKQSVHSQTSLPSATDRITKRVEGLLREIRNEVDLDQRQIPNIIDTQSFTRLLEQISEQAVNLMRPEWENTKAWKERLSLHQCDAGCEADRQGREQRAAEREERELEREARVQDGEILGPEDDVDIALAQHEAEDDASFNGRCPETPPKNPGCQLVCILPVRWGLPCRL